MTTVFDVAKYFLDRLGPMSAWKLQKLCYYAQAWTLAWGEAELFPEDFQAWSNGPVCSELFQKHKGMFLIGSDQFPYGDASRITPEQAENIDIICRDYGDKDPHWLREQTHGEAPWIEARGNTPVGERSSAIISKDSMGSYYGGL
jgi:uncharacterized phage-associated protein